MPLKEASKGSGMRLTDVCNKRFWKAGHLVLAGPKAQRSSPHPFHCVLPLRLLLVLSAALYIATHSSLPSEDTAGKG